MEEVKQDDPARSQTRGPFPQKLFHGSRKSAMAKDRDGCFAPPALGSLLLDCRHVLESQLIEQEAEDIGVLFDLFVECSPDAVACPGGGT